MCYSLSAYARFYRRILCLLLALSTLTAASASDFRTLVEGRDPMSLEGVDPVVAAILQKYYAASFNDADNWAAVKDFRFEASLKCPPANSTFSAT